MAARNLVSLSTPTSTLLLQQHRRRSTPSIYPPNFQSSPSLFNPNYYCASRLRFSPVTTLTPTHSLICASNKSESINHPHDPHWSAEYRRRLGIGCSPLLLELPTAIAWLPPEDGQIKVNFHALLADSDINGDDDDGEPGTITAVARNSSGDILGITDGFQKYSHGNKLELQLYGLRAAANLAEELRRRGTHEGPVVYESSHSMLTFLFDERCEGEPDQILRQAMPDDAKLEDAIRSTFDVYCGSREELKEMLPSYLDDIFELEKRDKELAGLI